MIRVYGKGLVATWRPFESGGGSHMRTSQIESEHVTVLDQIVITQTRDGFWATYPLANCSVVWQGKPEVTLINERDEEVHLSISGKDHTLADTLAEHDYANHGPMKAMAYSEEPKNPVNEDDLPFIDEASLVRYIRAALTLDGIDIAPELIERILMLEMEYLQHQGLAEHIIDDPRPES